MLMFRYIFSKMQNSNCILLTLCYVKQRHSTERQTKKKTSSYHRLLLRQSQHIIQKGERCFCKTGCLTGKIK